MQIDIFNITVRKQKKYKFLREKRIKVKLAKDVNYIKIKYPVNGNTLPCSFFNNDYYLKKYTGESMIMNSNDGKIFVPVNSKVLNVDFCGANIDYSYQDQVFVRVRIINQSTIPTKDLLVNHIKEGHEVKRGDLAVTINSQDFSILKKVFIVLTYLNSSTNLPISISKEKKATTNKDIMIVDL